MKKLTLDRDRILRVLIPVVYVLPAAASILTLILFSMPRFAYIYLRVEHESMGIFTLVKNTQTSCQATLDAKEIPYEQALFSYAMIAYSIVFWVLLVVYVFFAIYSSACACVAFASKPTSDRANLAKNRQNRRTRSPRNCERQSFALPQQGFLPRSRGKGRCKNRAFCKGKSPRRRNERLPPSVRME